MKGIMKHGDLIFGAVGTAGTITLTHINLLLGFVAGILTVGVMALRFRKEWKYRDKPPKD